MIVTLRVGQSGSIIPFADDSMGHIIGSAAIISWVGDVIGPVVRTNINISHILGNTIAVLSVNAISSVGFLFLFKV